MAVSPRKQNVVHFTFEETRQLLESADEKIFVRKSEDHEDGDCLVIEKIIWKKSDKIIAEYSSNNYYDSRDGEWYFSLAFIVIYATAIHLESRFKDPRNVDELKHCGEVTSRNY